MLRTHSLSGAAFDAVAAGYGGAGVVRALRAGQYSKRLLLIRGIIDATARRSPVADRLDDSIALLAAAQRTDAHAVREVLLEPQVGAWAAHCLRRLREGSDDRDGADPDLAHLGAIAVTAAVRAGTPFDIDLPLPRGAMVLPGRGVLRLPDAPGRVRVRLDDALWIGGIRLPTQSVTGPDPTPDDCPDGWSGVHRLTVTAAGLTLSVALDDVDPFRDLHRLGAAGRLTPAETRRWHLLLAEAWELLATHHRPYAEAIAGGLTTLVPLAGNGTGRGMSATSRDAFGGVSLTRPEGGAALAVALLHEFQHNKLGALLDLLPMYDPEETRLLYAPWRDDPRPLGGLLQGAYAFLGVADFWRVHRSVADGGHSTFAHFEYARWRERVLRVLDVLRDSGSFLPLGLRLLDAMRGTVDGWRGEPVPAGAQELAREASADHRLRWRLSNLRYDRADVARLATAYLTGAPAEGVPAPSTVPRARALEPEVRLDLAVLRMLEPERFATLAARPEALAAECPGTTAADAALVGGDQTSAVTEYLRELADHPGCTHRWAGLALAVRHTDPSGAATRTLTAAPELAYAVHEEIRGRGGPMPDPLALSGWLAPATPSEPGTRR